MSTAKLLISLKEAIAQKRPAFPNRSRIVFQQEIARLPHNKNDPLEAPRPWLKDFLHTTYSTDLAPHDYHS